MSLNGRIALSFYTTLTNAVGNVSVSAPMREYWSLTLNDGSGANQATGEYNASGTIGISSAVSFNFFAAGGLTDPLGAAVSWTKIKGVMIKNTHATQTITVTSTISGLPVGTIRPGGVFFYAAPDATALVVGSGAGSITLTNLTGSSTSYILAAVGV